MHKGALCAGLWINLRSKRKCADRHGGGFPGGYCSIVTWTWQIFSDM